MTEIKVDMREVGKAMKRAREHRGLTQMQLADASGVTMATIKGWEQGHGAHLCLAMVVSKTLNITISQYVGEEPQE